MRWGQVNVLGESKSLMGTGKRLNPASKLWVLIGNLSAQYSNRTGVNTVLHFIILIPTLVLLVVLVLGTVLGYLVL